MILQWKLRKLFAKGTVIQLNVQSNLLRNFFGEITFIELKKVLDFKMVEKILIFDRVCWASGSSKCWKVQLNESLLDTS